VGVFALSDEGQRQPDGTITFDGDVPMTWVPAKDPRWKALCAVSRAADHRNQHYPMTSKYAPGLGSYFRTMYVRGLGK
jgi:hypothetical protein